MLTKLFCKKKHTKPHQSKKSHSKSNLRLYSHDLINFKIYSKFKEKKGNTEPVKLHKAL